MNIRTIALIVIACATLPAGAAAQKPDSGAFFVRLGNDTIAVERFVRTPTQLIGEAVMRTPQTRSLKLTVTFREDGTVSWYELLNRPVAGVPNSVPLLRSVVTYVGDSAQIETWAGGVQRPTRTVVARGSMLPLVVPFYSTYELALARARRVATDTSGLTMLTVAGPLDYVLRWSTRDSATLSHPQSGAITAIMNDQGRLLSFDGRASTFKVLVTRGAWPDVEKLTAGYAALDAQGRAIGPLSPRDSIEFDVGDAMVLVSYGRPSKRGRVIFGGIVPWGEVWRTGANQSTQIEFTLPVEISGVTVPAGKYTLWTVPGPRQWQLIINKEIGQWGTAYDEKQDLARIPIQVESVSVPLEQFTIDAVPKGDETIMRLTWDNVRVLVPMKWVKEEE